MYTKLSTVLLLLGVQPEVNGITLGQMSRSNPHRVSVTYPNCHDEGKSAGRDYINGMDGISGINPKDLQGPRNPQKPCPGTSGTTYFYPHDEGKVYDKVKTEKEQKSDKKENKKEEKTENKSDKKADKKTEALVQINSVPACNSTSRPGCKDAKTAAGKWVAEDLRPVLSEENDLRYPFRSSGYAQITSVPACDSTSRPGCKDAKTAAGKWVAEDLRPVLSEENDLRYPFRSSGYAQVTSIPACNSSTHPGCLKAQSAAFFKPEPQARNKVAYQADVKKSMDSFKKEQEAKAKKETPVKSDDKAEPQDGAKEEKKVDTKEEKKTDIQEEKKKDKKAKAPKENAKKEPKKADAAAKK